MQIGLEPLGVTQKLPVPPPLGNPDGRSVGKPEGRSVGKPLDDPVPGGPLWPLPPPGPEPTAWPSQTFHVPSCFCTSNSTLLVLFSESTMVVSTVAESPFWVVLPIL